MYYALVHKYKIMITFSPKVNCTNIMIMIGNLLNILPPKRRNLLMMDVWTQGPKDKTNFKRYNYEIITSEQLNLSSYMSYKKIIIVREPLDRLVSGLVYLLTKEKRYVLNSDPDQSLFDFFCEFTKSDQHLQNQINPIDHLIEWDHVLYVSQFDKLVSIVTNLTGENIEKHNPSNKHWITYSTSQPLEKIQTIGQLKKSTKLPKTVNCYFDETELIHIKKLLQNDILFYNRYFTSNSPEKLIEANQTESLLKK